MAAATLKTSQRWLLTDIGRVVACLSIQQKSRQAQKTPVPQGLSRGLYNFRKDRTARALLYQCQKLLGFFSVVDPILLQIEILDLAAPQKLCGKCDPNNTGEGSHEVGCQNSRCAQRSRESDRTRRARGFDGRQRRRATAVHFARRGRQGADRLD